QHLAGIAEDLLHGVQIQALASHLGRLAVFAYQLGEAVGLTLGARYHLIAVTVGVLDQALGLAASLRHHAIGVGLGLVLLALFVLTGADHVVESILDLGRSGGALDVDLG